MFYAYFLFAIAAGLNLLALRELILGLRDVQPWRGDRFVDAFILAAAAVAAAACGYAALP